MPLASPERVSSPRSSPVGAPQGGAPEWFPIELGLRHHALMLAFVLVAGLAIVGPGSVFMSDEAAGIAQARTIVEHGGWAGEPAFPEVDPEGQWFPVIYATATEGGPAPLVKHPVFSALQAAGYAVQGRTGVYLLSVFGTTAAAVLAALTARRIRDDIAVATLWVVGVGSPLLFDAYLALAHSLAAAVAAALFLAGLRARGSTRWSTIWLVVPPAVVGPLLRSEFLILILALAVSVVISSRRETVGRAAATAGLLGLGGAFGLWADGVLTGWILGSGPVAANVPTSGELGWLQGRIEGFVTTWLQPGYLGTASEGLAVLATVLVVGAALQLRLGRRTDDQMQLVLALAGMALGLRIAGGALSPIPGILLAFPLLPVGLMLFQRRQLESEPTVLAVSTSVLFALGLLATQWPQGGSGEWGWRYFAVAIPILTPVLVGSVRGAFEKWAVPHRIRVLSVGVLAVWSLLAIGALRAVHQVNDQVVADTEALVAGVDPGDGGEPVLITTTDQIGRLAWADADRTRWLRVPTSDLAEVQARLAASGVEQWVLLALPEDDAVSRLVGGRVERLGETAGGGWELMVVGS
ncbi:MAG: hypothetical protein GY698_15095 [Actinomycetia bacterium]|nr:hypothetical protein [Actinomycetes bacterium]